MAVPGPESLHGEHLWCQREAEVRKLNFSLGWVGGGGGASRGIGMLFLLSYISLLEITSKFNNLNL